MKKNERKGKRIEYAWSEEVQNYCLAKRGRYNKLVLVEPLQQIKLSEIGDYMSMCETLQSILYCRTGRIDMNLGFTGREYAIELAKEMGVWD